VDWIPEVKNGTYLVKVEGEGYNSITKALIVK
jgi:hypothetical protein